MPRPELPIVQSFEIRPLGLHLYDVRSMSSADQADAMIGFRAALLDDWENKMPAERKRAGLCADDLDRRRRRLQRWKAATTADPNLTWDAFEQSGATVETDADRDPRHPQLLLGVRRGDLVVGAVSLININRVNITAKHIRARACCVIGIRVPPLMNQQRIWGQVYRYMLFNQLPLADQRSLEFFEWTFPTGLDVYRFEPRPWNGLSDMFDELTGPDTIRTDIDWAVSSIRRIDAPE